MCSIHLLNNPFLSPNLTCVSFLLLYNNFTTTLVFQNSILFYFVFSMGQETGRNIVGHSARLQSRGQLELRSHLRLEWGRICSQTRVVVSIHFLTGRWMEASFFLLEVSWWWLSVPGHVIAWPFVSSGQQKKEEPCSLL